MVNKRVVKPRTTIKHVKIGDKRTTRGGRQIYSIESVSEDSSSDEERLPVPQKKRYKATTSPEVTSFPDDHGMLDDLGPPTDLPKKVGTKSTGVVSLKFQSHSPDLTEFLFVHQSQNAYMEEYKKLRPKYIQAALWSEASRSSCCQDCLEETVLHRCRSCQSGPELCASCFCKAHRYTPWHHPETWKGTTFAWTTMLALGFVLHLGHSGDPCPYSAVQLPDSSSSEESEDDLEAKGPVNPLGRPPQKPACPITAIKMIIVDSNGVFDMPVQPCQCPDAPPLNIQLCRSRIFPASSKRPKTGFTFRLLDLAGVLQSDCKLAPLGIFKMLQRITNEAFPDYVPVSFIFNT